MTKGEIITIIIEIIVFTGAFIIGRYVIPKMNINTKAISEIQVLLAYAETYTAYARQFLGDCTGIEKMNSVVSKLKDIADQYNIKIDEETLRAIGQKAYDTMITQATTSQIIIKKEQEASVEVQPNISEISEQITSE